MRNIVHSIFILVLITVTCIKADEKTALIFEEPNELTLKNRHGRTTYVKAILSNPQLPSTHVLAEKLAKEALRSPRTQETLKKLTEISPVVKNRRVKNSEVPKKHHRKRKRKKHKHRGKKHRRKHGHHKNTRKRRLEKQISGNSNDAKRRDYLKTGKIQVKRNDIDCTINRSIFFNPIRHPLPISEPFYPESSERIRRSRQVPNSSLRRNSKKVYEKNPLGRNFRRNQNVNYDYLNSEALPLVDVDENPLVYVPDDNLPRDPANPIGLYSFERDPDDIQQIQGKMRRPVNPRALHITKNDVSPENTTVNCTTEKSNSSSEVTKSRGQQAKESEYHPSSSSKPPEEAVHQSQGNYTGLETKQVANEILNEIIEELEELKVDHNRNNPREGLPCKISGTWVTIQAGVELKMKVTNHTLSVTLEKMSTADKIHSGIINTTWNISGHVPFRRGAPFSLLATNSYVKSLATFVGACRVCQGVDTIEGVWSVIREPKGCRDLRASISVYNEALRRVLPNPKRRKKKT